MENVNKKQKISARKSKKSRKAFLLSGFCVLVGLYSVKTGKARLFRSVLKVGVKGEVLGFVPRDDRVAFAVGILFIAEEPADENFALLGFGNVQFVIIRTEGDYSDGHGD